MVLEWVEIPRMHPETVEIQSRRPKNLKQLLGFEEWEPTGLSYKIPGKTEIENGILWSSHELNLGEKFDFIDEKYKMKYYGVLPVEEIYDFELRDRLFIKGGYLYECSVDKFIKDY